METLNIGGSHPAAATLFSLAFFLSSSLLPSSLSPNSPSTFPPFSITLNQLYPKESTCTILSFFVPIHPHTSQRLGKLPSSQSFCVAVGRQCGHSLRASRVQCHCGQAMLQNTINGIPVAPAHALAPIPRGRNHPVGHQRPQNSAPTKPIKEPLANNSSPAVIFPFDTRHNV